MAKTTTSKTPAFFHQDTFDKATIKVLHELQKLGFCRNVASIEEYLEIPKRNLWQAVNGQRHVSRTFRSTLMQFFANNYNVNPDIFQRLTEPVFKSAPPTLEEQTEPYFTKKGEGSNVVSMGDFAQIESLKKQLADKNERIKELEKDLKYYRGLVQKTMLTMNGSGKAAKKSGRKPDKKPDKKR